MLKIYEFYCNSNFGFPNKINSVINYRKNCQYHNICYLIYLRGCSQYLRTYSSAGESV